MLRNRVITALLLAPAVIFAVWYLPPLWFTVAFGLLILGAGWEWAGLSGAEQAGLKLGFLLVMGVLMVTARDWAGYALEWLAWPVVAWWLAIALLLRKVPSKLLAIRYPLAVKLLAGGFVLVTAWILLVWLRLNFGVKQVLYLIVLVWTADSAAYVVGTRLGHTRLSPEISPNKTAEGMYSGLFAALLLGVGVGVYQGYETLKTVDFAMLSVITVLFSVVGDLFESLAKRIRGVKDSGTLLPGHGGVLDRIDSLLAAVPVFYAGSYLLEIFL